MKIDKLVIENFRNYSNQTITFKNGINVLEGKNAQGKTNLLEAIFLCSIGKSPRTSKDKELIKFNSDCAYIKIFFESKKGKEDIEIILPNNQNKTVKINGVAIKKMGELMEVFNTIYFSPDELKIVKEGPADRRNFMDIDISQVSKVYFYLLQRYQKTLNQRNKLLKNTFDFNVLSDTISIWDAQLAELGSKIIMSRIKFINKLKVIADKKQKELTNNKENLFLEYQGITGQTVEEIKATLLSSYKESLEKDFSLKYTTVGPHRDDFKIQVNNIDIRSMGSQGQKRTTALSLKLAELEIFANEIGEYPVLLLDDVLSELDEERRIKLLESASKIQTILTCTEYNEKIKPSLECKIVNGKVSF